MTVQLYEREPVKAVDTTSVGRVRWKNYHKNTKQAQELFRAPRSMMIPL